MQYRLAKIIICLAVILSVGSPSVAKTPVGEISAFVSILPQAYFVERVGGSYVNVSVLVGPGQSPATYEPTPKQMARLGRSQLYFRIGTPFERGFIDKISRTFANLKIIDTREGVMLRYFKQSQGLEVPDPHIWLDPKRVKIQAETIFQALKETDPAHADEFEKNLKAFQADLDRVDAKITGILAPLKGGKLYVFHPAFGYFAESYGLTQVAVEIEGKEPSPKQLARLINRAKRDNVKIVFVQPQYATKEARTVAKAIGGAVVPINPLPRDYLKNLEDMANIIEEGLRRQQ
ncbi:MAG: zinc ABC transporter substrate-binding protein [Deltaproteobacteria bacterium]|nr:zinc ABC transporter substrate-binding protein [Deltaproteobacteria bacterium]